MKGKTGIRKKMLAMMVSLAMVLGMMPAMSQKVYADGNVAEVWHTDSIEKVGEYTSLKAAFEAASGAERFVFVKLLDDVTVNETLTLNQDINLFLQGHTLTFTSGSGITGNVTGREGQSDGIPQLDVAGSFEQGVGGSIVSAGQLNALFSFMPSSVDFTVTGGSVAGDIYSESSGTIGISGGDVQGDITIYSSTGALSVTGGTVGNIQTCSNATITGGTITSFGLENGTAQISGGSFGSVNTANNEGTPVLTISGNTVIDDLSLGYYDKTGDESSDASWGKTSVAISGNPKIKNLAIDAQSFASIIADNWGSLTITGGYFGTDPHKASLLNSYSDEIKACLTVNIEEDDIETYSESATDWAVSGTDYPYRFKGSGQEEPAPQPVTDPVATLSYWYDTSTGDGITANFVTVEDAFAALGLDPTTSNFKALLYGDERSEYEGLTDSQKTKLKKATPIIELIKNTSIATTVSLPRSVRMDLNGHTLEVTQAGKINGTDADILFAGQSGTGRSTFTNKGVLALRDVQVFADMDFNMTAGTADMIHFDCGNINISGGKVTALHGSNSSPSINAVVNISGDAQVDDICPTAFSSASSLKLSVSDTARVGEIVFYASNPESGQDLADVSVLNGRPNVVLQGGYYKTNPAGYCSDRTKSCFELGEVEEYSDQTDWAADPATYKFRIKSQQSAPVHVHKAVKVVRVEPTTEANGNIEYWKCEGCGKLFSDSTCTKEIALDQTVIAKLQKETTGQKTEPSTGGNTPSSTPPAASEEDKVVVDSKTKAEVVVTDESKGTADYTGTTNSNAKSATVPDTVTYKGKKVKVTRIAEGAFSGSKVTTVTLGKNVKMISPKALKGSKVNTIIIKSKLLTKKSVKNAFKGGKSKKVIIKVDLGSKKLNRKYVKKYKKIFTAKNTGKKVTVKAKK